MTATTTARASAPASFAAPLSAAPGAATTVRGLAVYLAMGTVFGILLVKSQVVSWFRMQEMFRFDSFYMYGVFATAIPVALIVFRLVQRFRPRALNGEAITVAPKQLGRGTRYWAGGLAFGLGWALTGACPGPLFALLGSGIGVFAVVIASAVAGTWVYGHLRPKLPH